MPAKMTASVWGQGVKNGLLCLIGILVCSSVIAAVISLGSGQSFFGSLDLAPFVFFVLVLLFFFGGWVYSFMVRGRLLLECGPHPMWWLFSLNVVLFLVVGSEDGFDAPFGMSLAFAGPAYWISFLSLWFIMATGRLQVREHGIWQYWSLLRWDKIESYSWKNDRTLLLRATGPFSFLRGALPIPPEKKEAIDDLLTKYRAAQSTAK